MYNPYIVIPLATWLITQSLKFGLAALRGELNFKYLYASGGMPSVHSAVVCSLATTALLLDGASSHLFGLTLIFAAIVMYDSFGVRRSAGEQAVAINMIVASLGHDRVKLNAPGLHLREVLGHSPAEVSVGAILGVALGLLFNLNYLTAQIDFITALPVHWELVAYIVLFAVTVVGGWLAAIVFRLRYKGSKIMQQVAQAILAASQTIGWLGLVVAFGQYQHLPYLSYRVWSWLLLVALLVWKLWLLQKYWRIVPEELDKERENQRKTKWLKRTKKRK
jgi:acid phosphatase family membrane protein YuiD